jgi:UDP-N-acetyl-D-mannosaminuronic acid transferase (WecB/TagA/CpsF family)
MNTQQVLGLPFFTGTVEEAVEEALRGALVVAPSGPNLAGELRRVSAYRKAVQEKADVVLTDSAVMVAVFRFVTGQRIPRHSGLKFLEAILADSSLKAPGEAFWVMPSEAEGASIARWLRAEGWSVDAANTYVAPFYKDYPISDDELLVRLKQAKPRVVFLNLAGGKQEVLGAWLRERLEPRPGIVCTGAAIAFLAGTQASIPVWADRAGLGWLMRCFYEPKKFIPRYWRALPLVWLIARYKERSPVNL